MLSKLEQPLNLITFMVPTKATGSCSNASWPGRQKGSLTVSHLPDTRMERAEMSSEPSCSASRAEFCCWVPQVPALPGVAARVPKQLPHRAKASQER